MRATPRAEIMGIPNQAILEGLLCQACPIVGLLEDRSWDQVQAPRVLIPTLHRPSWSGGMAKPAKAMYDLASWVYHQVAYLQDEGD